MGPAVRRRRRSRIRKPVSPAPHRTFGRYRQRTRLPADSRTRLIPRYRREVTEQGNYATLFFAEYDDDTRKLRYSNCGHPPALLVRGGEGLVRLEATCTVVGLFKKWECKMEERELAP